MMTSVDEQRRKEAIRSLINIVILEGLLLIAVVGIYFYTNNITYLVGGIVAVSLIFGPVFFRFVRDNAKHLKSSKDDGDASTEWGADNE